MEKKSDEMMSWPKLLGFGLGAVGMNLCFATVGAFTTYFFTDYLGIASVVAGNLLMISRIFDGFSDIAMGTIVDRTRSKHGKARPWLLWLAIPMGLSMIPLFSAPDLSNTGKIIWAFITYNLVTTIMYTAVNVPYMSMTSLLTDDPVERSKMSVVKMTLAFMTALFVSSYTTKLVTLLGGGERGWQLTAAIYGVLIVITFYIAFASTKEKHPVQLSPEKTKAQKGELKNLFRNKYWLMMVAVTLLVYTISGTAGATIYYCKYIFKNENLMPTLTFASQLPTIIVMVFVLTPLVKKFGKRNVSLWGVILQVIGCLVMAMSPENVSVVVVGLIIKSAGSAGLGAFIQPMIADTITYGQWKYGTKGDGKAFGGFSFGMKCGTGIGTAMIGWLLALGGYVATNPEQTAGALKAIEVLYIYIPMIAAALIVIILWFYKLDKEYPTIIEELKQRGEA